MIHWDLFFSIYVLIFLAELPDKTAFATLLMATRSRALPVFIGVAAAFFIQTVVATLFGHVIAFLPARWVHFAAGILFLIFAVQMWRTRNELEVNTDQNASCDISFWQATWKSFLVIFIAEWGDITQIATASLIAKYNNDKLTVFTASLLALWSVTAVAVVLGHKTKKYINPTVLKKICCFLFLAVGIYFLTTSALAL